ncbi:uncharacterized protein LOC108865182 [Galendromus occidentalis]|uniref:Uncharacterized protein LOC108865182 n=1 Tax=Galendromus occidentalis TaxID=34638 RepID=A0AAJ7PB46_9ACAR|nr:uncharacterized protein LOC108865182 [Galendromus occidentalis]
MEKIPTNLAMKERSKSEWTRFRQKLEIYMRAAKRNADDDETKTALLLAAGGDLVLEEYNAIDFPEPTAAIVRPAHKGAKATFSAYKFRTRVQGVKEPFATWLTDLKILARDCHFEKQEDRMMRNQLIYGIRSPKVREDLLKIQDLDLQQTVNLRAAAEAAKKQAGEFENDKNARSSETSTLQNSTADETTELLAES